MMRKTAVCLILLLAGAAVTPAPVSAEDRIINGVTLGDQVRPALAARADGTLTAVWISGNQDDGLPGIYARNLDENGEPAGIDFQVNTFWAPHERPRIAMNSLGRTVVSSVNYWIEGDTSAGVSARIFDAAGGSPGQEFQVNIATTGFQGEPDSAMDGAGNILFVWQSDGADDDGYGILARRFDPNGNPLSPEILINDNQKGDQLHPAVAMDRTGGFVVAWSSEGQDGDRTGIYARRFDSNGTPLGGGFRVNFTTAGWQEWPGIAMDSEGGFVIVWHGYSNDQTGYDVFARTYDRTATLIGPEIQVNEDSAGWQLFAAVDLDEEGNALVAWQGRNPGQTAYGIFARLFDGNGQPTTSEFRADDGSGGTHEAPAVAMLSRQSYTIIWQGSTGQDTGWDIRGRTFRNQSLPPDPTGKRNINQHEKHKKILRHPPRTGCDGGAGLGE